MKVPPEFEAAWKDVTVGPTALSRLESIGRLRDELAMWEAMNARQALADGETWATIGAATGTSRQAAWERLRPGIRRLIEADRQRVEAERDAARERHERGSRIE